MDAQDVEPGCESAPSSQPSEQPSSLLEALSELTQAIAEQNAVLMQIVAQNADIMAALSDHEENDDGPRDMLGRRVD